jgi:hypothetical protein
MVAELPAGNELVILPIKKQTKPESFLMGDQTRVRIPVLPRFLIVPLRGGILGQFGWQK